jgi:hypothetical protein
MVTTIRGIEQGSREDFRAILENINDELEGGDVVLDFEAFPAYHIFLDVLNTLVGQKLRDMKATDELMEKMERMKEDDAQ